MNEIIALQKYENEAQLAKELIRGFWLAHGDYVITDEEAAENLAAWTDKGDPHWICASRKPRGGS